MKSKKSSGNVFHDIGFDREKAEHLRIRAMLMTELEMVIKRQGLSQTEAAKKMGVTQPRVSDLMRGKIDLFSIDSLIHMLSAFDMKVRIHVSRPKAA